MSSRWLGLLGSLYVLVTFGSFLGKYSWIADLMSSFRVQLAMGGAIVLLILAVRRSTRVAAAGVLLALCANLLPLSPYWSPQNARASDHKAGQYRLMTLNLHHVHADLDALVKVLEKERPSFLVLTEFTFRSREVLDKIGPHFKYSQITPNIGSFGIMLFSQEPIRSVDITTVKNTKSPIVTAEICPSEMPEQSCFRMIALHAPRPEPWSSKRDAVIRQASNEAAQDSDGAVLVVGDLNLTPWSPVFSRLLETGNLSDSAFSQGLKSTWLSRFPLFGLMIDHILYGRAFTVTAYRVGPDVGSDHYPLIADVGLDDQL